MYYRILPNLNLVEKGVDNAKRDLVSGHVKVDLECVICNAKMEQQAIFEIRKEYRVKYPESVPS